MKLFIFVFLFTISTYSFGTSDNDEVTKIVKINQLLEEKENQEVLIDQMNDTINTLRNNVTS